MVGADPGGLKRAALMESIEALLRPLMPLLLNNGISYADVQDVLRTLYVESMGARIRAQGRPATATRLALMAGMNVGEVESLTVNRKKRLDLKDATVSRLDEVARLLSVWHDDPRFSTPYGAPLDLSLLEEKGFRRFDDLVEAVCPTVDRDLLLDELVAADSIQIHDGKFIRCVSRTFLPTHADVSRIYRFGRQSSALNATFAHNLLRDSDEPAYFERGAVSESLVSEEYRDEALAFLAREGQEFLNKFDRWGLEQENIYRDESGKRYGVSVFFHEDTSEGALGMTPSLQSQENQENGRPDNSASSTQNSNH